MRTVPMEWTYAVDLIQHLIRKFAFSMCRFSPLSEVNPNTTFPIGDATIVCMDGIDVVSRRKVDRDYLRGVYRTLVWPKMAVRQIWRNLTLNVNAVTSL